MRPVLNHPLQSPNLQTLLTILQTKLEPLQQTLATGTKTLSPKTSNHLTPHSTQIPIKIRRAGQALLLSLSAIALLLWNWQILLALAVGLTAMSLVYQLQTRNLQPWIAGLHHWLNGPHRTLLLCVPCGGIAMLGTYMGINIWDDSHNAWLVSCILLQGFGMVLGLALLSMQTLNQQSDRFDNSLDAALSDLTHPNPLNRLIAIRQLNRLSDRNLLNPEQTRIVSQALQLLLAQEPETLVREATLHSLELGIEPEFSSLEKSGIDTL